MTKYFFNVRDVQDVVPDEEGSELPTPEAAHQEAKDSARDLLKQTIDNKGKVGTKRVEVTTEQGKVVETVRLNDLLN